MMKQETAVIAVAAAATFGLMSGCPLPIFTVRVINNAEGANVLALYLDNTATQGEDSGNYLSSRIASGGSRTVRIPLEEVDEVGADALYIGGAEDSGQIVELESATFPVMFSAGGRVTITMAGAGGSLEFDIQ